MHVKITPVELQKREFPRKGRGLDPESVRSFLTSIAEDFEELIRENAELETRLKRLEEENFDHREREKILKETLLSAQRLSEEMKANARRESEVIVRQAELAGQRITAQAMEQAAGIEKAVREMRLQRQQFRARLRSMLDMFESVLDFDRDDDEAAAPVSYLARPKDGSQTGS